MGFIKKAKYDEMEGKIIVKLRVYHKKMLKNYVNMLIKLGGQYNKTEKLWYLNPTLKTVKYLYRYDFCLCKKCLKLLENKVVKKYTIPAPPKKDLTDLENNKLELLRDYQKKAVEFLKATRSCLLADDQGLGKTIVALGYLKINMNVKPVLIICPKSLKANWNKEIRKWLGNEKVDVLNGRNNQINLPWITIVNWDILSANKEVLKSNDYKIIIADEVHYAGNVKAKRTKAFLEICEGERKVIALSGTPVNNSIKELYPIFESIKKGLFKNYYSFLYRYTDPKHNGFGWTYKGASNINELRYKIAPYFLRREKTEVLKELPRKQRQIIPLKIAKAKKFDKELRGKLKGLSVVQIKEELKVSRLASWELKKDLVFELIDNILHNDEKLVVFAHHKKVIKDLMDKYESFAVKIDGSVTKDRGKIVEKFQNDSKIKVFIGQDRASAEGVTLTSASKMLFAELDYVPTKTLQCEDRIHRFGQKESVIIYYPVLKDSVEETIAETIKKKLDNFKAVMGSQMQDIFDEKMVEKITK